MHSNFFLKKRKILGENRLLVMRDLANGFIDKQDIKFGGKISMIIIFFKKKENFKGKSFISYERFSKKI